MTSIINGYIGKYKTQDNVVHSLGSTAYGYCETAADVAEKVVDMTGFTLVTGATVFIKFQYNNSASNPTLNVNGTGDIPMMQYGSTALSTTQNTNGWRAGAIMALTYDGTNWIRTYMYNNTYTIYGAYCTTEAATAAKVTSCTYYKANKGYFELTIRYDNSSASALTLNVNSTGAKPIYINGEASSSTNYTLPGGLYIVYYDGSNYYFNTDGTIPFLVEEAPQDGKFYARKDGAWIDITSMLNT